MNTIRFWNGNGPYRFLWVFLPMVVMTGYLYLRYSDLMLKPDEHVIAMGFDGAKNYFTTAWHLKHDLTALGYEGMNFPYGEHVLFTDNQPILVNTARLLATVFPELRQHGVGLLNLFQIFSLILSVFSFVLLFRRLNLPGWYGAMASVLLVLLSPQHLRFDAHFGMSHIWVIPTMLLMLHTYEFKVYRRRISIKIGLFIAVVAQLHMYYFGLFFLYLSIYHLLSFFRAPHATRFYKRFVHWALMLVVPYGLLQFWLSASHSVADRSTNPYGFNAYKGYWEGLFLPYPDWPLYNWISRTIMPIRVFDGEASAYVGAFATLFFLFVLFRGFRVFTNQADVPYGEKLNRNFLRNLFWAAVILGVFACGFPHAIPGFEWIKDWYGPIRQFRSTGRFNWLLFYVFNVTALFWLWHYAQTRKQVWMKIVAIVLPFCLLSYEAWQHQMHERSIPQPNTLTRLVQGSNPPAWMSCLDTSRNQAILPLPYYHLGSENLVARPKEDLFLQVQRLAYATGIPDMGVHMSRTSIRQTVQQMQLHLEQVEVPRILVDFESEKTLALFTLPQYEKEARAASPHLFEKARLVHESQDAMIWILHLDDIRQTVRAQFTAMKENILSQDVPLNRWKTGNSQFFRHENYDGLKGVSAPLLGSGALKATMSDSTFLYQGAIPKGKYTISFWIDATLDQAVNAELKMIQSDASGNRIIQSKEDCRPFVKAIQDGWALVEIEFEVAQEQTNISLYQHKIGVHLPLAIDECQIRPSGVDVFYRSEHYLSKNNRWYVD